MGSSSSGRMIVLLGLSGVLMLAGGAMAFLLVEEAPPRPAGAAQTLPAEQPAAAGPDVVEIVEEIERGAPVVSVRELTVCDGQAECEPVAVSEVELVRRPATPWSANATKYRGQNGQQFEFMCPPGGRPQSVWGDHPYTDDSSICSAAVHAGLIPARFGGHVLVEIRPGQKKYRGTYRNGIKSNSYGAWSGSFVFPQAKLHLPAQPVPPPPPEETSWTTTATRLRDQKGKRFVIDCPPDGQPGSVWGANPYTDDSSICTAAVHAGMIKLTAGGPVEIEIVPGRKAYRGCAQNGIRTYPWGRYDGSFRIVGAEPGCSRVAEKGGQVAMQWQSRATELFGQPGDRFEVTCPKNGAAYAVWGANPYTDDSSVCTAAVHAGRIDLDRGGSFVVIIQKGQEAYAGSRKNGIKSDGWGPWRGSFAIE